MTTHVRSYIYIYIYSPELAPQNITISTLVYVFLVLCWCVRRSVRSCMCVCVRACVRARARARACIRVCILKL